MYCPEFKLKSKSITNKQQIIFIHCRYNILKKRAVLKIVFTSLIKRNFYNLIIFKEDYILNKESWSKLMKLMV